MKKVFMMIILLLLAIIFWLVWSNDRMISENQAFTQNIHLAKQAENVEKKGDIAKTPLGDPEKGTDILFSGELLITSKKVLQKGQSKECQENFKKGENVGEKCAFDEVISMKRADGKEFDTDLYAIHGSDNHSLAIGCKVGDNIVSSSYGKFPVIISPESIAKILESIDGEALYIRLAKKMYDAYEPKNVNCAVFWNILEVGKKDVVEK